MIDADSVITRVLQRNYPAHWRVYYGEFNPGCLYFWRRPQSSTLVILPQGVVKWNADDVEDFAWLNFPEINRIQLAQETQIYGFDGDISTRTSYWLDIYCSDGTYLKWPIDWYYRDVASIAKTIIAAYSYYWQINGLFP